MPHLAPLIAATTLALGLFGPARPAPTDPPPTDPPPTNQPLTNQEGIANERPGEVSIPPGVAVWPESLIDRLRQEPTPMVLGGVPIDDRTQVTLELDEVLPTDAPRVELARRLADGRVRTRLAAAPTLRFLRGVAIDAHGRRHPTWIAVGSRVLGGFVRFPDADRHISSGPHLAGLPAVAFDPAAVPASFLPEGTAFCNLLPAEIDGVGTAGDQGGIAGVIEGVCREVDVAVETDVEFTENLFGGDAIASAEYALALLGAVGEIFRLDVETRLRVGYLRLWEGDDPWDQGGTGAQLGQFRDHWQAQMGDVERDLATFLSGRGLGGGVAWLPGLCSSFGYSLSANLNGSFPYPIEDHSGQNWDLMVVSHELGHNFGAPHTHSQQPPIDGCGNGDCSSAYGGTIMSYCHTCSGGLSNVAMRFHPGSIASMKTTIDSVACDYSGAATPAAAVDDTLVAIEGESNAIDPLANDREANCEAIELLGHDAVTLGGRPVIASAGPAGETLLAVDASVAGPSPDEFTYEILDGEGTTATGTVHVVVTVVRPAEPVVGTEPGAVASYFEIPQSSVLPDFDGLDAYADEIVPLVDYPSTGGPFAGSGRNDFVAAVFEGWLEVPTSGVWRLFTHSDDGSRLFVGDTLVVDNDGLHGMVERSGDIGLAAGRHPIRVEFFENQGGAGLIVRWSGPGVGKTIVPASAWSHGGGTPDPDIDGDGLVDGADLAILLGHWGACGDCPADLDGDGVVGGGDLAVLLATWTATP
jgi:hypothetical protein